MVSYITRLPFFKSGQTIVSAVVSFAVHDKFLQRVCNIRYMLIYFLINGQWLFHYESAGSHSFSCFRMVTFGSVVASLTVLFT